MEDTELTKKQSILTKRRPGIGLPFVLITAVVGALLVAVVMDMATRFASEDTVFRDTYSSQVLASSYVERARGLLTAEIISRGVALHPRDIAEWNNFPEIQTLEQLQIFIDGGDEDGNPNNANDALIVDEIVRNHRVTMRVYDLTYSATAVQPTGGTEEERLRQRLRLPAPLALNDLFNANPTEFESVIFTEATDIKNPTGNIPGGNIDLRNIGVYLIRVQIFDTGNRRTDRAGRLVRTTEEAFFIRLP